ncbi:unnamed protein product [Calicophoron daubneyi]|uniref:Uncharacterized protein n=1 Tax=Calicophoron daubneyi TaxID=300641 RepID=A0AAV2TYP6_CALDB
MFVNSNLSVKMEETSLAGKIALITGAGCGIGKATALLFAKLGARLVLVDLREEDLKATTNECNGISETPVLPIVADIADDHMVQVIHQKTLDHFDGLDILKERKINKITWRSRLLGALLVIIVGDNKRLRGNSENVNNAGIFAEDTAENFDPQMFDRCIKVNLRAPIMLTQAFIAALVKSKGAVVNVSSMASLRVDTAVMSYGVSKAGQDMFTKCAALQLAPKGVRVNSVHPGFTNTSIMLHMGFSEERNKDFLETMKAKHPTGRCAEPIEIARAIAFLVSPAASFITAAPIPINGGFTTKCDFN